MKIYIASPYSNGEKLKNVRRSILAGEEVVALGHTPFLPLLNHFWQAIEPHDEKFWIDYDIKWLEVCDALLRLEGKSKGGDIEVAVAERLGIPVYYSLDAIPK